MKDIAVMTEKELQQYGLDRVGMMIKMKEEAEMWLQQEDTPLHRLIVQTAEHHLTHCEELFGLSRYDQRFSSLNRA